TKPYALGIATDRQIWYSSYYRDVMGKLDPQTGKVVEYPMPYTDNGMRDFFVDKDGRMWFATPPNNRVCYFYVSNKQRSAAAQYPAFINRAGVAVHIATPVPARTKQEKSKEEKSKREELSMKSFAHLATIGTVAFTFSAADAATITGTVKGPDGAPFRA